MQLVLDLIVTVKEACSFDIRWIKGHSGNKGQELADGLAKEAAREIQHIRITDVTLKDVKHFVQCKTTKEWQTRWQNHTGAAKNFIQVVNPNKIKYMKKMSKKNLGVIFPSHYWSWSIWPSYQEMEKNDTDQNMSMLSGRRKWRTAWHLWSECPSISIHKTIPPSRKRCPDGGGCTTVF